ncbi:MAG: GTPase ObgE [Chloroflexi bacterium]|nr:GTPase ObgE [Chloroflexota bacterium]
MFDYIQLRVKAGDGGNGAISFRREKFVPYGGPDGGDGGDGGNIILRSEPGIAGLGDLRRRSFYSAEKGGNGQGKKKHGRRGKDVILSVPPGTLVWDLAREQSEGPLVDLTQAGQEVVIARGGRGGWGNIHFASAVNRVPRIAQKGQAGEERTIILELRLIADVGIIGYPNVGKSSLLAAASGAKPKVGSYPFTTLEPVLGVVQSGLESFVLAEIPGLIEDAHLGRGLGLDFLRHAMRTKMFIHLVDGSAASPVDDMLLVNTELSLFDPALGEKPQLVVVNKIDLPEVSIRLEELEAAFRKAGVGVSFIAAATGEGVSALMVRVTDMLKRVEAAKAAGVAAPARIFRPRPGAVRASVSKEGETFVVTSPALERIAAMVDLTDAEIRRELRFQLERMGGTRALVKAGIKPGDKVRCGVFEWEW